VGGRWQHLCRFNRIVHGSNDAGDGTFPTTGISQGLKAFCEFSE
jgi:hypothetical protein